MDRLQELSLEILSAGLANIRHWVVLGDMSAARAEVEHLYNLPTIIAKNDRHAYLSYIGGPRTEYIRWVRNDGRNELLAYVKVYYLERWNEMNMILGLNSQPIAP
jgi:hypothetical protein